jgi:hypothetical protein
MLYKKKKLSNFKKIPIIFVIGCMLILYFQYEAWKFKVLYVSPSDYAENAVDLKVTQGMRYGFVWSYHGSFLVKTENTISLRGTEQKDRKIPPMPQGEDDKATDRESRVLNPNAGTQHKYDDQMFKVPIQMREELELVPAKTALETCLYLAVFSLISSGPSLLVNRRRFLPMCSFGNCMLLDHVFAVYPFSLRSSPVQYVDWPGGDVIFSRECPRILWSRDDHLLPRGL